MKAEDKNLKRTWRRGNALDVAVILLILLGIVALGYRYYQSTRPDAAANQQQVVMSFRATNVIESVVAYVVPDDVVYLAAEQEVLGTVLAHPDAALGRALYAKPASVVLTAPDGSFVSASVDGSARVDVEGRFICQGSFHDSGVFLLNGVTPVSAGQTITVYTEQASFVITVTALEAVAVSLQ